MVAEALLHQTIDWGRYLTQELIQEIDTTSNVGSSCITVNQPPSLLLLMYGGPGCAKATVFPKLEFNLQQPLTRDRKDGGRTAYCASDE